MWPFSPRPAKPLGTRGERLAEKFLRRRGMKLLARNYRCPGGEIDLIMLDPADSPAGAVCFVEVKTRTSGQLACPLSAVDAGKRRRLMLAARHYAAGRAVGQRRLRFDAVAVVVGHDGQAQIEHVPDAFGQP